MSGRWGKVALVVGIAIALVGSGVGYMIADSEHQYRGWIMVELKNVGSADMVAALIVSGAMCKSFNVGVVNLSGNESLHLGIEVQWHSNNTFWVDAWCGKNATPIEHYGTYQIVKAIRGQVINVTLSLDMALVR